MRSTECWPYEVSARETTTSVSILSWSADRQPWPKLEVNQEVLSGTGSSPQRRDRQQHHERRSGTERHSFTPTTRRCWRHGTIKALEGIKQNEKLSAIWRQTKHKRNLHQVLDPLSLTVACPTHSLLFCNMILPANIFTDSVGRWRHTRTGGNGSGQLRGRLHSHAVRWSPQSRPPTASGPAVTSQPNGRRFSAASNRSRKSATKSAGNPVPVTSDQGVHHPPNSLPTETVTTS